jgi:phosphoribosylanthranilate isomerase
MPTEVKICGLSDPESVDAALQSGADYVGFVFFEKSPRNVELDHAAMLATRARGKAGIVALTVDAPDMLLSGIVDKLRPDFLQLHGMETPERVISIRERMKRPVIKVLGVAKARDLAEAGRYSAERLLLDAKPPRNASRPGGLGQTFDWSILADFRSSMPWFLSGGLTPGNVGGAIETLRPAGVDVSSGVESAPGRKDAGLIHAFIAAVRAADRPLRRVVG